MGCAHVSAPQKVEVNCGLAFNEETQKFESVVAGAPASAVASTAVAAATANAATPASVPLTPVDMGNPHAVTFVKSANEVPLEKIGPAIEKHAAFPGGVNAEFVNVISPSEIRMRVWERGSGITWACGTGSCASVAAAIARGECQRNTPVTVHLDGGDLIITLDDSNNVNMTGPAAFVCDGETL